MTLTMPQCLRVLTVAFVSSLAVLGQSNDPNFPTPLTSSSISGKINARPVGDARDTTYYFAFEGEQGDIFLNVTTKNFAGTIDVFSSDTTRTLTRIPIFPDANTSETGRVIYLRKSEKLLLRVQGRSPDDNAAAFQVKFAGSFLAIANPKEDPTAVPTVLNETTGNVRVNSVGTIIAEPVIRKTEASRPTTESETVAEIEKEAEPVITEPAKADETPVVETSPVTTPPTNRRTRRRTRPQVVVSDPVRTSPPRTPPRSAVRNPRRAQSPGPPVEPKPDPLANVRLVIELKSGEVLERPLPEVLRFSVDKGVLVVIGKDGVIRRYPMVDVAKVTIQ